MRYFFKILFLSFIFGLSIASGPDWDCDGDNVLDNYNDYQNNGSITSVILFDRWWNPAVEDQAVYRACRFERKNHLHVLKFLTKNTIEERINTILNHKKDAFEEYIDNAQSADIQ